MEPIRKTSLGEAAARRIETGIHSGLLSGLLPATRELSRILGISPGTLKQALEQLGHEGIIRKIPHNGRHEAIPSASRLNRPARLMKKLWLVEPVEFIQQSNFPTHAMEALESGARKLGWTCEWTMEQVDQSRSHRRHWDQLLKARNPDALIFIAPHATTAAWAANCGVPVCALGGDTHESGIVTVSFDATSMVETALTRLFQLGHRDVLLPLTVRTPGFVKRIRTACSIVHARHSVPYASAWNCPSTPFHSPSSLGELLEKRFSRQAPSAIVAFGSSILPPMGYLLKNGYRVPDDISLVVLGGYEDLRWADPQIAHFDLKWNRMVKFILSWLAQPEAARTTKIQSDWIEGGSVARPRRR
ncbi:MAG: GntR family transcriptional regulator [Luteolibacter sp.]